MEYLIGIDGGGTATRARLLRGEGRAGPSGLGQGIAQAWANVQQAIAVAALAGGLREAPAPGDCALGLGLAGAHVRARCDEFLRAAPPYGRIALDNDAYTALL